MSDKIYAITTLEYAKTSHPDGSKIIALSPSVYEFFKKKGTPCDFIENIAPSKLFQFDKSWYEYIQSWFKNTSLKKIQKIHNIDLLLFNSLDFLILLNNAYTDILLGEWLAETFKNKTIVFDIPEYKFESIIPNETEYYSFIGIQNKIKEKNITYISHDIKVTNTEKKSLYLYFLQYFHNLFWMIHFKLFGKNDVWISSNLYGLSSVKNLLPKKHTEFGASFKKPSIKTLFSESYIPIDNIKLNSYDKKALKKYYNLLRSTYQKDIKQSLKETILFNNINIGIVISKKLTFIINSLLPQAYENHLKYKSFLKKHNPKLLIVNTHAIGFERHIAFAKPNHISIIMIQHGIYGDTYATENPSLSEFIIALGQSSKEQFKNLTPWERSTKIFPYGHPRWNYYEELPEKSICKDILYSTYKIKDQKNIIFYPTQSSENRKRICGVHYNIRDEQEVRKTILNSIKNIPNAHLIIKYRQNFEKSQWFESAKSLHILSQITLISEGDLGILVKGSDLVLTGWSTIGLETLIIEETALVTINLRKTQGLPDYNKSMPQYNVTKKESLTPTIKNLFSLTNYEKEQLKQKRIELKKTYYTNDTKKIKILINKIIGKSL